MSAEVHIDLALAVWLRWAASAERDVQPSQEILGNGSYWALLQVWVLLVSFAQLPLKFLEMPGDWLLRAQEIQSLPPHEVHIVDTGTCEHEVFTAFLFLLSTHASNASRTFTFDPRQRNLITASWSKYSTLIEIVSLSTSPNQLRDATPNLKRLLDPSSHIPASWMVVLVTLGFQSGSGGVSRGFWDIMLSLEPKRLGRLFGEPEGRKLLQDMLLPYAAYAANFVIGRSTPEKCEHGTQLAEWLGRVVNAVESKKEISRAILVWIAEREDNLFAPARAWILKGLLEGVGAARVLGTEDLRLLVRIAAMQRFTKLKVDVCLAAVLRLMLAVDIDEVGFAEFWS